MSNRRRLGLSLAFGSVLAFALVSVALATHPRPGSGAVLRVPLVPAFQACSGDGSPPGPNSTHVLPIALPSCTPPALESDILTMGTTGAGAGSIKLQVICNLPETVAPCTSGDGAEEQDISLDTFFGDVQCQKAAPGCTGAGADYTGQLIGESPIRITDHANGTPAGSTCATGGGGAPCVTATVSDTVFSILTDPGTCVPSGSATAPPGSACTFSSSINSEVPGFPVKEFQRGVVSIFGLRVMDLGEDGVGGPACPPVCTSPDNTRFLDQGLFIP